LTMRVHNGIAKLQMGFHEWYIRRCNSSGRTGLRWLLD